MAPARNGRDDRPRRAARIIGLVSDTHGLLRPEVIAALHGVDLILHAGDVGGSEILDELQALAPVRAVLGNTDVPGDARLSTEIDLRVGDVRIHVSHGHELGSPTPATIAATYLGDVLVYGHTHRPLIEWIDGRLIVNPGAAGPRRFDLMPSVAILRITGGDASVDLVWI
jgi:hypothetical protein